MGQQGPPGADLSTASQRGTGSARGRHTEDCGSSCQVGACCAQAGFLRFVGLRQVIPQETALVHFRDWGTERQSWEQTRDPGPRGREGVQGHHPPPVQGLARRAPAVEVAAIQNTARGFLPQRWASLQAQGCSGAPAAQLPPQGDAGGLPVAAPTSFPLHETSSTVSCRCVPVRPLAAPASYQAQAGGCGRPQRIAGHQKCGVPGLEFSVCAAEWSPEGSPSLVLGVRVNQTVGHAPRVWLPRTGELVVGMEKPCIGVRSVLWVGAAHGCGEGVALPALKRGLCPLQREGSGFSFRRGLDPFTRVSVQCGMVDTQIPPVPGGHPREPLLSSRYASWRLGPHRAC